MSLFDWTEYMSILKYEMFPPLWQAMQAGRNHLLRSIKNILTQQRLLFTSMMILEIFNCLSIWNTAHQ